MTFTPNGREVDVAIGDWGFRLATSQEKVFGTSLAQSTETIPVRKEQFDTEAEPGEQSLADGWWRRSQASFHQGAGYKFQETSNGDPSYGFWDCDGIDPWTQGEVRLTRVMNRFATTSHKMIRPCTTSTGAAAYATVYNNKTIVVTAAGSNPGTTGYTLPANVYDYQMSGNVYYVVGGDNPATTTATTLTAYRGDVPRTWGEEGYFMSPGGASGIPDNGVGLAAVGKGRVWAANKGAMWQIMSSFNDTGINAIYSSYMQTFGYTCIAAAPGPMLFGGHDGNRSEIQSVTLDQNGTVPTISGARTIAQLPDGELVLSLAVLAGEYVGIGTNKGFRVGVINGEDMTYGPLLFKPENSAWGCRMVTTNGRYFLVAGHSKNYVYQVDTGVNTTDGVLPYAKAAYIPEATAGTDFDSIAVIGGKLMVIAAGGLYTEDATTYRTSGSVTTGRIRFRTTEPKLFKYLEIETEPLVGSIAVSLVDAQGNETVVGTASLAGDTKHRLALPQTLGPTQSIALKFTLTRGSGASQTPVLNSYQVKALPAVKPQRMLTLPLICFDQETSKSGQRYGYKGYCDERLAALQDLEDSGDTLTYQNFLTGTSRTVVIDSLRFVETGSAAKNPAFSGKGGYLVAQLRTAVA